MTKRPPSAATLIVASFALTALAIVGVGVGVGHAPPARAALAASPRR